MQAARESSVGTHAAIATGATLVLWRLGLDAGAPIATRAAVEAGTALMPPEPRLRCAPERQVALNVVGGAAVQLIEDALPVLRRKRV